MGTVDLVGLLAGTLTTLSFLPQVLRTWQSKDVSGLSLGMYLVFTIGVAFWVGYGILLKSWPIVLSNGITLALAGLVLTMKLRFGRKSRA